MVRQEVGATEPTVTGGRGRDSQQDWLGKKKHESFFTGESWGGGMGGLVTPAQPVSAGARPAEPRWRTDEGVSHRDRCSRRQSFSLRVGRLTWNRVKKNPTKNKNKQTQKLL